YFLVKALTRTPRGELIVTAQAFKGVAARTVCSYVTWTNQTNGMAEPNGTFRKTTGADNCFTNAGGSGDGGARSIKVITGGNWELHFSFDSNPEGRCFAGLTTEPGYRRPKKSGGDSGSPAESV